MAQSSHRSRRTAGGAASQQRRSRSTAEPAEVRPRRAKETASVTPPSEAPIDRRIAILDAAIREFGDRGRAGARVDRIAEQAGCNKQLIYYYFKSKDGLYRAAMETLMHNSAQAPIPDDLSFLDLVRTINAPSRHTSAAWHRFWLWEALERDADDVPEEDGRRLAFAQLIRRVEQGKTEQDIDPAFDTELLALAVIGVTALPHLLPHITRLITGMDHLDRSFQNRQRAFLGDLAAHLSRPPGGREAGA